MTPPRLHVLTASRTDYAVILRRGPARSVATIGWHRSEDTFELGQWLHGRIYEHRSDLSPDGRHMIYFAGSSRSIRTGSWHTVVSRAPWLHAIAFLPQEWTWHGGGAFTETGEVFLNGGGTLPGTPDGLRQAAPDAFPHGTDGFHMGALYAAMQARRGWVHAGGERYDIRLTKSVASGWSLEATVALNRRNRALLSNAFALTGPHDARIDLPDWEWAEVWKDGVHFAAKGALFYAEIGDEGVLRNERLIRDFSDMKFERIRAPYDKGDP
jgi:hypothetical protein